jgi:hypothetical protein
VWKIYSNPDPHGSQFSRLLHTRGCGESIPTRILTGPHSAASYGTQGDVENLFQPGFSWVPVQSPLTTHKGMWRIYSNPDPDGSSFNRLLRHTRGCEGPILTRIIMECEIWGFEKLDIIECVHLEFLKFIFNLKSNTPSYMVYGETGRYPVYINTCIYSRMISYWAKLFTCSENKIVTILYRYLLIDHDSE